jgi:superfamily II DNA/RNA helicase
MFSATMPPEVERMARAYLRHPAIVQIGDEDTGKNKRIVQHVLFMTEGQKKSKLTDQVLHQSLEPLEHFEHSNILKLHAVTIFVLFQSLCCYNIYSKSLCRLQRLCCYNLILRVCETVLV